MKKIKGKDNQFKWNVKDFNCYDEMTEDEKEERKRNKKNGRDSLQYKQDKEK